MKKTILTVLLAMGLMLPAISRAEVPERTVTTALNTAPDREHAYRHRTFRAYFPLHIISERLKVGSYSSFENPTGIFFKAGDKAVITISGTPRQPVKLIVHDFEKDGKDIQVYDLSPGRNTLDITARGLAYLDYRDANPDTAPAIEVDIQGGRVNGIFSHTDTNETWEALLAGAACGVLDIVGERCQLVFDVADLRQACAKDGHEMITLYDRIVEMQQLLLGWDQFKCHPGNHIMGRVQWSGFMHADRWGAAFVNDALPDIVAPDSLHCQSWGPAHEFGHVNQTRPAMNWAGMGEVTNNIFSAWADFRLNPRDLRLEHETCTTTLGWPMRGGRFDCYINNALVRRQLWQFQGGPDSGLKTPPGAEPGDSFVTVCPLWQLQLYNAVVLGNENFYPRIFRKVRLQDDSKLTHGEMRVNFFLNACESAQLDFTDFFVSTGMLAPMDRRVEDYTPHTVTITPEMCQAALEKAAQYPKPESSVIYYLNGNNVEIFRKRLPVQQSAPIDLPKRAGYVTIPAGSWQNAVAFEAVDADGKLLRVAILGFANEDNTTTLLFCPKGTAAIRAVQWDGTRFNICK